MNACKIAGGLLVIVTLGILASACAQHPQTMGHYRLYRDMKSFTEDKSTLVYNRMPRNMVSTVLGPGEELTSSNVAELVSSIQGRGIFNTVFPLGVQDRDVFLGYPIYGGRSDAVLQFREGQLVNNLSGMCITTSRDMSHAFDGKDILVWLRINEGLRRAPKQNPDLIYVAQDGSARIIYGDTVMPWVALPVSFMAELKRKIQEVNITHLGSETYGRIIVDGGSCDLGMTWCGEYRQIEIGALAGWRVDNTQILAEASCLTNIIGFLTPQMDKMAEQSAAPAAAGASSVER